MIGRNEEVERYKDIMTTYPFGVLLYTSVAHIQAFSTYITIFNDRVVNVETRLYAATTLTSLIVSSSQVERQGSKRVRFIT